ncbi:glycosyltransferase [Nibribacter ruber]|uniref:Glycosyltransferase n=1 Tax=Nibribacter ruber TaxID=2698458 RepID=A0A6P1P3R0_9BACT|nr:glycosyltransferase family 2 protein [Nibribacter ruber]QHL89050.1 glycosyltransferase [Nibribacter ruber]
MISIIIPTYNRDEMLGLTLVSVVNAIEGIKAEVLVINDSPGRIPHVPAEIASKVQVLQNPKRGVGAARNFGVESSKGDYIIFLDDDFLVTQECLLGLRQLLIEHPDKIFNAAWIYPPDLLDEIRNQKFGRYLISEGFTSLQDRMKGLSWNNETIFERSKGVSSGILAISRENFIKTGGYAAEMVFGNDGDFSLRIKSAGLKPYIAPTITAFHNERDKMKLELWLNRRKFGIRQLVKHNMVEQPQFPLYKKAVLSFLSKNKGILNALEKAVPNMSAFDWAYKSVVNALFAVYLFEAYTSEN